MSNKQKKIVLVCIPVIIALISIFGISRVATSTKSYQKTIQALDNNKKNVLELMAGSTAASAAITVLPGDVATPIAEELADISSDFIIVLSAIYLEKFLLTIIGFLSFVVLIPLGCLTLSANVFLKKPLLKVIAEKLLIFGCLIVLVIPVSVKISSMIDDTYGSSISETIEDAKKATEEVEAESDSSQTSEDEQSWLGGLISSAKNGVSKATKNMEKVLNNMVDALAILIVTSCIIPILVILLFVWLAKTILNINAPMPPMPTKGIWKKLPVKK